MPTQLEVERLDVDYGRVRAVRGLSFAVSTGQTLALLGANGAGKTSAVEAVAGLLPKAGGRVTLDGRDVTGWSAARLAQAGVALVPQWRELFPGFSVHETLLAALHAGARRGRRHLDDIYALFPRLDERRRQFASTLSGGEQQMLAIGRALAVEPRILLLDEPTAGLAVGVTRDLVAILHEIRRRRIPIVLIEQNLALAEALADECVVLAAGSEVWRGPARAAHTAPEVSHAYLGTAH